MKNNRFSYALMRSLFLLLLPLINLYSDGDIVGKVIDFNSMSPLENVRVYLLDNPSEELLDETYTDERGLYAFREVPSGKYQVGAELNGFVAVTTNPIVIKLESNKMRANFSLGVPGSVIGTVVDSVTNTPLVDAVVDIMRGNTIIASTKTDAEGNYRFDRLAPRPYIIRVRQTYFQSNLELAVPKSNEIVRIDIALKFPPGKIAGQIINSITGSPILNAIVSILENGIIVDSVQANEDGSFFFYEVAPGNFHILAIAQGHDPALQEFCIESGQELATNFALDPLGNIRGSVTCKITGKPLAGVSVGVWKNGNLFTSTHTDEAGVFTVEGIKECTLVLQLLTYADIINEVKVKPGSTSLFDFALDRTPPTPPRKVVVEVAYKRIAHKINRVHYVKWRESPDPTVVAYRIYRNGKFIAEVSAKESFVYKDRWRSSSDRKYEVSAVNDVGLESEHTRNEGFNG